MNAGITEADSGNAAKRTMPTQTVIGLCIGAAVVLCLTAAVTIVLVNKNKKSR